MSGSGSTLHQEHGSSRPGYHNRFHSSAPGSTDDITSLDRLSVEEEYLEDLEDLSDEGLMEVLMKNLSHGRLLEGDEYARKLAKVLGVGEDQYAEFARIGKDTHSG